MNVWLVDPFDSLPGESLAYRRYSFLAEMLANMGHKVTWWSSNFHHPTKTFRSVGQATIELKENLAIVLLKTPGYDGNMSARRIWNHYTYAKALQKEGTKYSEVPDVVVANSTPLLAANRALMLARRYGAKCIVDVQDIWPEAFEVAFPQKLRFVVRMLSMPLKRLADRIYDEADGITAVSRTYLQRALAVSRDKAKPTMLLPLGVDLALYRDYLNSQPPQDMQYTKHNRDEFWVVYAGTIGKSYDIKTILEAAGRLGSQYPNIRFLLAGDGPDLAKMQRCALRNRLTNVTFTGLLGLGQLALLLDQCDVGVNAIVAASRTSLPNKPFVYMAAGLPIINSVSGELEDLIMGGQIGLQYEPGSAESLAKAILQLHNNPQECFSMGQRARKVIEERFDMNKEYSKFAVFINDVASRSFHSQGEFSKDVRGRNDSIRGKWPWAKDRVKSGV